MSLSECVLSAVCNIQEAIFILMLSIDRTHGCTGWGREEGGGEREREREREREKQYFGSNDIIVTY